MAQLSITREFLLRVYRKHAVDKVRGVDMEILANKDNLARLCKNVIKEYNLKNPPAQIQRMIKTHKQRRRTEKRRKTTKPKRSPRMEDLDGHPQKAQELTRAASSRTHKRYNSAVDALRKKPASVFEFNADSDESPKRHMRTKSLKDRPSRTQSKRKRLERLAETPPLPGDQGELLDLDATSLSERPPARKKKKKKKKRNSFQELSTRRRSNSSTPRSSRKKKKKKKFRKSNKREISKNRSYSDADAFSPRVGAGSLQDDEELPPITFEEDTPQENSEKKKKKKKKKKSRMSKKSPLSSSSSNTLKLKRQDTGLVGDVLSDQIYPDYDSALALVKDSYSQRSSPKSAMEDSSFDFSGVVEDARLPAIKQTEHRGSGFIGSGLLDSDQLPDYQAALAMVAKSTSYIAVTKEEESIDDVKQESDPAVLPPVNWNDDQEEEVSGTKNPNQDNLSLKFDEFELKQWFALLDANNSGTLSAHELITGFQMLGIPLTEEEAKLMAPEQLDYESFRDIFLVATSPVQLHRISKKFSRVLTPDIIEKVSKASVLHSSFRKSIMKKKKANLKINISNVTSPAIINAPNQKNDSEENGDVQRGRALSFGGGDTTVDDLPLSDYLTTGVGPASPTVQDISNLVSIASEKFSDADLDAADVGGGIMDDAEMLKQSDFDIDKGVEIQTPTVDMIDERLCSPKKQSQPMLPEENFIFLWRFLVMNSAHDKKVDLNGLIVGFKKLEMPLTEEEGKEMFESGCTDDSGLMTFEAFKKIYGMPKALRLTPE